MRKAIVGIVLVAAVLWGAPTTIRIAMLAAPNYLLLVPAAYKPQPETRSAPQKGGEIVAVAKVRGRGAPGVREKK